MSCPCPRSGDTVPAWLLRKAQASAEEAAAEQRLRAEVQRPSAPPAGRASAAGSKRTQSQLLAGVVKKKARTNSAGEAAAKPGSASAEDAAPEDKGSDDGEWISEGGGLFVIW